MSSTSPSPMPAQPRPRTSALASLTLALRAAAVITVLGSGLLLILGTADISRREARARGEQLAPFGVLSDTLALLASRTTPVIGRAEAVLHPLRPATLLAGSFRAASDSLAETVRRLVSTPSLMPTQGWLSSEFSRERQHPILHVVRPHEGIDVQAAPGTPILAPAAGTVIRAGWQGGYGLTVEIDHGFDVVTRYAHTSATLVSVGERVQRGQVIARVGNTGLSQGPHLHYEVHVAGRAVDPLQYVLPAVIAD